MSFDVSALNSFRNVTLGGDNAIANLGAGDKVVKKNDYHGGIGKIFRSGSTKAANNAIRTELLRSLGKAFGLEGVSERDGKLHFSADFMARLEGILGRDVLKSGDFKIGPDGSVTSGKPLTQRRISAVVKQATLVGKGEYDYGTYKTKLSYVKGQIEGLKVSSTDDYAKQTAIRHFEKVAKLMEFAKNELPHLIDENFLYDSKQPEGPKNPKCVIRKNIDGHFDEEPLTTMRSGSIPSASAFPSR